MFPQSFKNRTKVIEMVGSPFGLHDEIIHVALDHSVEQIIKYDSHSSLVCGSRIFEPERHDFVAIDPLWSSEGRVYRVLGCHLSLIVTR